MSRNWIIVGVAAVCFVTRVSLSHRIEPGVRVGKVMLTGNTPAIRLFPATPGPHPIVLLAHGSTSSKENLFRFGEALAAAGFECYSVDQAGHGESPEPLLSTKLMFDFQEFERALGALDVFVGDSFGGWVGAWSVHYAGFRGTRPLVR